MLPFFSETTYLTDIWVYQCCVRSRENAVPFSQNPFYRQSILQTKYWAGSSIFFIFAPLPREEGGGGFSEGRGVSLKSEEKGRKKGGGGVDAGKGSGAFLGGEEGSVGGANTVLFGIFAFFPVFFSVFWEFWWAHTVIFGIFAIFPVFFSVFGDFWWENPVLFGKKSSFYRVLQCF